MKLSQLTETDLPYSRNCYDYPCWNYSSGNPSRTELEPHLDQYQSPSHFISTQYRKANRSLILSSVGRFRITVENSNKENGMIQVTE